jgi:hypothetical protein
MLPADNRNSSDKADSAVQCAKCLLTSIANRYDLITLGQQHRAIHFIRQSTQSGLAIGFAITSTMRAKNIIHCRGTEHSSESRNVQHLALRLPN